MSAPVWGKDLSGRDVLRHIATRFRVAARSAAPQRVDAYPDITGPVIAEWYRRQIRAAEMRANIGLGYDVETRQAYAALAERIAAQYDACAQYFDITHDVTDPYPNSRAMFADVAAGRLRVFASKDGDHPLLTGEQNTQFRAVHDLFGHAMSDHGFGPLGEERAYWEHARMFDAVALRALATETRGQNSYVNYGPDAVWNRRNPTQTRYAPQIAAAMPLTFCLLRTGE